MQEFLKRVPKYPSGTFLVCECRKHNYPKGVRGHAPVKILQNYTRIYTILVLSRTTFKDTSVEIC